MAEFNFYERSHSELVQITKDLLTAEFKMDFTIPDKEAVRPDLWSISNTSKTKKKNVDAIVHVDSTLSLTDKDAKEILNRSQNYYKAHNPDLIILVFYHEVSEGIIDILGDGLAKITSPKGRFEVYGPKWLKALLLNHEKIRDKWSITYLDGETMKVGIHPELERKMAPLVQAMQKQRTFLVNSSWGKRNKSAEFLKEGKWQVSRTNRNVRILDSIENGDYLILNANQTRDEVIDLKVEAIGIVTSFGIDAGRVDVSWVKVDARLEMPRSDAYTLEIARLEKEDYTVLFGQLFGQVSEIDQIIESLNEKNNNSEASSDQKDINRIIQSALSDKRKFWWFYDDTRRWNEMFLHVGGNFLFQSYATKHEKLKVGDLLLTYGELNNQNLFGLFEISGVDNTENEFDSFYCDYIKEFEFHPSIEQLNEIQIFKDAGISEFPKNTLLEISSSIFNTAIAATEIDIETNPKIVSTINTSKIAQQIADVDKGEDYLGIDKDVTAFAKVIASDSFSPPLAIALFGQWGAGKSFFMNKLNDRIEQLSASGRSEYRSGIAQIHFNAWSYLDANLWASLVSRIFEGLNNYIKNTTGSQEAKEKIEKGLSEKLSMIREERELLEEQIRINARKIAALRGQRTRLKNNLSKKVKEVEKSSLVSIIDSVNLNFRIKERITKDLSERLNDNEFKKIKDIVPQEYWGKPDLAIKELKRTSTIVQRFFSWRNIGWFIIWIVLAYLLYTVLPYILQFAGSWTSKLESTLKIAASSLTVLIPTWKKYKRTYDELMPIINSFLTIQSEYDQQIANAMFEHEQQMSAIGLQIDQISDDLELSSEQIARKEDEQKELDFRLNHALSTQTLYSYISNRAKSADYKKHLGIVSTIRNDFGILSDLFTDIAKEKEHKKFRDLFEPRLERIVLYIDDLDRCKDEQVIQVLEAVNLIMAFPLFVVVVGVDPRWVKNALIKEYNMQFSSSSDNGLEPIDASNYLEKIFQIPFHLEEAADESVKDMLRELSITTEEIQELPEEPEQQEAAGDEKKEVQPQQEKHKDIKPKNLTKEAPPENEHLALSKREVELIQDMSGIIGTNPRAIKRFVNVYHIVRAHEGLGLKQNIDSDYLAIMFLLAFPMGRFKKLHGFFQKYLSIEDHKFKPLTLFLQSSYAIENDPEMWKSYDLKNPKTQTLIDEIKSLKFELDLYLTDKKEFQILQNMEMWQFHIYNPFVQRFTFTHA